MIFDYCNMEPIRSDNMLLLDIGCRFADEPEELYVIQLNCRPGGEIGNIKLMFNSMDCKYRFKEEELKAVEAYVEKTLLDSEYEGWYRRGLPL